jgi:peroxiredoxin
MNVVPSGLGRSARLYLSVVLLTLPPAFGVRWWIKRARAQNVAAEARKFVAQEKEPLSATLSQILHDRSFKPQPTQEHPLLGRVVEDFTLADDRRRPVSLADLRRRGPVLVVFYYGYSCPHCVGQLFAISQDAGLFDELGVRVVAISADPPELTTEQFEANGRFLFPVLSDPGNRVARAFGASVPATADGPERLLHATFVLDPDGRLLWAYRGPRPFLDNKTLLIQAARAAGVELPGRENHE